MNPGIVVLDATGTLVDPAGSVGEAYAAIAGEQGARLDPRRIERGFTRALGAAPPLAFGRVAPPAREAAARHWWRAVARDALAEGGELPAGFAFELFFDRAWTWFAGPAAWRVHDDVRPALRALRVRGLPLAVFSNWDLRLEPLLAGLGLGGWFCRVLVSGDLTDAKPSRAAFEAAATELAAIEPVARPLMVGDRLEHDVRPAIEAGWDAVWLDRAGRGGAPAGAGTLGDLRDLSALLG